MSNSLPTLAMTDLESVTGGAPVKGGSGSPSSSTAQISSALTGLQSSIKDLSNKPSQTSAFGGTNVMLFAMLAINRPAATQTHVVYVRRRGCW